MALTLLAALLMGQTLNLNARATDNLKMICYSIQPNEYLNDHAAAVAKIYDGFFFTIGSWDGGVSQNLSVGENPAKSPAWMTAAKKNLESLRKAGVTENLIGVHFGQDEAWPSPELLLSQEYTQKMKLHFSAIGKAAKELGFRGVSIDTEYPYPRFELDHPIYTYNGYTAGDLMAAAYRQGYESMKALLDAFPEAVIFSLPGSIRTRPLSRQFIIGMLTAMAERDASGGFHLGTEFAYSLLDPVTQMAIPRFDDGVVPLMVDEKVADYWRRRCTMSPGVWPLHLVETGGKDYPVRPWKEEVADLRQQMAILRSVTKRYLWCFSGAPSWFVHSDELEKRYGLKKQTFKQDDVDLALWHAVLRDKPVLKEPKLLELTAAVREFDSGKRDAVSLCDAFGAPAQWMALGVLSNPKIQPAFAAEDAVRLPIDFRRVHYGRDGAVRWFRWDNVDPRGIVNCITVFDYLRTEGASAHFVTFIHAERRTEGWLHLGWDDGLVVRIGNETVFNETDYGRGHGWFYQDRYAFERRERVTIPAGVTPLMVTSMNAKGSWMFSLRFTDDAGMPLNGIRFRTER